MKNHDTNCNQKPQQVTSSEHPQPASRDDSDEAPPGMQDRYAGSARIGKQALHRVSPAAGPVSGPGIGPRERSVTTRTRIANEASPKWSGPNRQSHRTATPGTIAVHSTGPPRGQPRPADGRCRAASRAALTGHDPDSRWSPERREEVKKKEAADSRVGPGRREGDGPEQRSLGRAKTFRRK